MMRAIGLAIWLYSGVAFAAQVAIPPDLDAWRGWALQGEEQQRCPFLAAGNSQNSRTFRCAWPQILALTVNDHGGNFSQRWEVFAESWLVLPGSPEYWPIDVKANGTALPVVMRGGQPQARLPAGSYLLSGSFSWSQRPAQLPVSPQTALIALTVDGRLIGQPARSESAVSLGARAAAAAADALEVQVYRLVEDDIPVRLTTQLRLDVAGEGREVQLSRPLPAGFTPMTLSSELPVRIDADGSMRVQVRPGHFALTLTARGSGVAQVLSRPPVNGLWAREEIWSFAGADRLRVATAEGAEGIDPSQANVPGEWQGYPAFRVAADGGLRISERSRGLSATDENRLTLNRQIWLDFNHAGWTAVDTIGGTMRSDWRLQTQAPFHLESARSGDTDLLISEVNGQPGVEVRTPQLQLTATSRTATTRGRLPASGWSTRVEQVRGTLHLPPGHRLLAAPGADDAPGTWWSRWTLWSLFGVLIVVVFTHRVAGLTAAIASALAMLLLYQESPEHIWLWANLLVAVAIARSALPGRWRQWSQRYRNLSFGLMGLALLPLLWGQLRLAIHPQLEGSNSMLMRRDVAEQVRMYKVSRDGPPPVAASAPMSVATAAPDVASSALEEVVTAASRTRDNLGLNAVQAVSRYAPGTLLQAGPGVPTWQYNNYDYSWTGPVQSTDTVRFVYIGPLLLALWRIFGVLFTGLWFAWLLQAGVGVNLRWPNLPRSSAKAGALLLCFGLIAGAAPAARAAATPDNAVLQELRNRLLKAPDCLPTCGELNAARVSIDGNRLEVTLQMAALANVAVPIPSAGNRWQIDSLSIDGQAGLTLGRETDGSLWVPLHTGAHTVRIVARVSDADSVSLAFPQVPRSISVIASGWDAAGVNNGRLVAGALDLTRRRSVSNHGAASVESAQFPAFVRVTRNVQFDIDWSVTTTVERLAPDAAAITMALPLLAGESVLTPGMQVRGKSGAAEVIAGIAAGAAATSWNSGLAKAQKLELRFPTDAARTEVWNFSVSPQWSVAFTGFPAVLPENIDSGNWVFQYRPRPGEQLTLSVTRPTAAHGTTLAIDNVSRQIQFGTRTVDEKLELNYRSTQGGRHTIQLPADARVQAVRIDNEPVQLRPENGELSISLLPGTHHIGVDWQRVRGAGLRAGSSGIDLHANASNIHTVLVMPLERWPLAATRALAGPVVRYWGELLVFVLTAFLLGRIVRSPLRTYEWLLLGFGLSTQSWTVFALMVAWFFAMRWRAQWQPATVSRGIFRLVQIALASFTVIAIGSLLFSGIRYGFLSAPDMGVTGDGSYGNTFGWFHDQSISALPEVAVYSVPLWCYKALMFGWALWIAFALTRWLRWAWSAWMHDGGLPHVVKVQID